MYQFIDLGIGFILWLSECSFEFFSDCEGVVNRSNKKISMLGPHFQLLIYEQDRSNQI